MGKVLGGIWQTTFQKWGHVNGTAIEVYAAMITETLAAAWCYAPAVVTVLSDNNCRTIDVGRTWKVISDAVQRVFLVNKQ